ncbi:MAG: ATP-binding protein [Defluviitaleaceae bacterium]|nr:ATP-binding protein [Defluviitaleaceae bacterium]
MKKLLFLCTSLIIFAGFVGFLAVSMHVTNQNNLNIAKNTVMETARISAALFNETAAEELSRFGGDTRITVISSEGIVLIDTTSEIHPDEIYLYRPEIVAAATNFPAVHVRHSSTHNADFIYYALRVQLADDYVFLRTSIPVASINAYLFQSLPGLIILFVVLGIAAFLLIRNVTNRILQPFGAIQQKLQLLSDGKYTKTEPTKNFEEVEKIIKNIDEVAILLQKNYEATHDEKNKLAFILNSIGDGIFVVDENECITLANIAACEIFSATNVMHQKLNYLVSDKSLSATIEDCVKNANNALFEFQYSGKIYLATIKRLANTKLTMTVLANITESRENAKRREEFFANASHELKTPLTAIRGFSELISTNNKDENLQKYIDGTLRETTRMSSLIADMLKISELENMQEKINPTNLSLSRTISEAIETISPLSQEKSIIFETTGEAEINAEPEHLFETVKNLIENAARYSNPNSKVTVTITNKELTISDNGIGIPPEEQTKIFERFYRVEKSRSLQSGGTGLGLSIVKHICALYGWKVSLKSKMGIGTSVTIDFKS